MKVELHLIRRNGIKLPEREAAGIPPLMGELELCQRWVSATRTLPALELTAAGISNGSGLLSVLYEPRLVSLGSCWLRFTGYEVLAFSDQKQLVIQEWRCCIVAG